MSEPLSFAGHSAAGAPRWAPSEPPRSHRLLIRLYPRWFRDEFHAQLTKHLARQRVEPRYGRPFMGGIRFWWHVGTDALATSVRLRLGRARDRWARLWGGASTGSGRFPGRNDVGQGAGSMLDAIVRDFRHAMRGLTRNPGYTLVFIVTLGLGIGANTAMFSAVNGVLLRPLPHEDGDRLVYLRHSAAAANLDNVLFSVPEIDDYRQGSPSLGEVAEFSALTFTMLGSDNPRRVRAGIVTGNYFDVMGLSATLGRTIGPEDDGEEAPAVIALSDSYWRRVFGADPEIVGKTVEINGRIGTFVGVVEAAPPYPERTDIYVNMATSPHHLEATMQHDRIHRMTEVFAKLAPGATVASARTEVDAITARIHAEYPEAYDAGTGYGVSVTPLKTQLTSRARPTLLLLLATATLVLIIACANLANLTLTRVLRRDHELAIRVSLGGSRGALRRSLLAESLVLALGGAAVGLMIASVGLDLLVRFAERFTSRASEIALDANVFGFALIAAVAASLFFTVLPPLPDGDRGGALTRGGTRSTGGAGAKRAQRVLVVAQIATSFVLLIGAGLLVRTILHLSRVDPGFETAQVLAMDIPSDFQSSTPQGLRDKYVTIHRQVEALPGVESAALTSSLPFAGTSGFTSQWEISVDGFEPAPGAPAPRADFRVASPGYFATMGIEILRGREFVSTDVADGAGVVIINEAVARTYFGERNPVGEQIAWTDPILMRFMGLKPEGRTVVGVIADTRDAGLDADVIPAVYNPYDQITPFFTSSMVVRVNGDPNAVLPAIRKVILDYDPNQPIANVATLAQRSSESVAPRRLNAILLGAFALLAMVIAAVGIGGVLAFSVGSRTHEFGIRGALGAARHQIWSGVLAEGARLAAIGVALGALTALALTRFVAGLLVGVPAFDPVTYAVVGVLLAGVAILAAWLPAWRAAAVSPMKALATD